MQNYQGRDRRRHRRMATSSFAPNTSRYLVVAITSAAAVYSRERYTWKQKSRRQYLLLPRYYSPPLNWCRTLILYHPTCHRCIFYYASSTNNPIHPYSILRAVSESMLLLPMMVMAHATCNMQQREVRNRRRMVSKPTIGHTEILSLLLSSSSR